VRVRADAPWHLEGFEEQLDAWAERESSPDDLKLIVMAWLLSRMDSPYVGVRREPGFPNLWFGPVPGSEDGVGRVVCCSYWIFEERHLVRCNSFATLNLPI
jgi:hypothetical protein